MSYNFIIGTPISHYGLLLVCPIHPKRVHPQFLLSISKKGQPFSREDKTFCTQSAGRGLVVATRLQKRSARRLLNKQPKRTKAVPIFLAIHWSHLGMGQGRFLHVQDTAGFQGHRT
jgi:hypothetical protein